MLSSDLGANEQVFEEQMKKFKSRTKTIAPDNLSKAASLKGELANLRKTIVGLPAKQVNEEVAKASRDILDDFDKEQDPK